MGAYRITSNQHADASPSDSTHCSLASSSLFEERALVVDFASPSESEASSFFVNSVAAELEEGGGGGERSEDSSNEQEKTDLEYEVGSR